MDRQTANELCERFGVAPVPAGADPQEWLDDNDVFGDPAAGQEAGQRQVIADVFGGRIREAAEGKARTAEALAQLTAGLTETTAWPFPAAKWEPVSSELWGAFSSAPDTVSVYKSLGKIEAVRHEYGNAVLYFVQASTLASCLEEYWICAVRTHTRGGHMEPSDPVAGIAKAARHILDLADRHGGTVYGGSDAVRLIEHFGRGKLEQLATLL